MNFYSNPSDGEVVYKTECDVHLIDDKYLMHFNFGPDLRFRKGETETF